MREPLRLLVHFQPSAEPLVQLTEATREGTRLIGAGSRVLDLTDPARELELSTGERVTVAHVLAVLNALARS